MGSKKKRKKVNLESCNNKLFKAQRFVKEGTIYGYVNEEGEFKISPRFSLAYDFNNSGTAIVQVNNFMGLINRNGDFVMSPIYDSIEQFNEGRAIFSKQNNMGVIDERGNILTKKGYSYIGSFNNGAAVYGENNENQSYLYGYLDKAGNEIIKAKYMVAFNFVNDKALVKIKDKSYGIIDKSGEFITFLDYNLVYDYSEGLMVFSDVDYGLLGYIDDNGKIIIEPKYKIANGFKDSVAIVSEESLYNGPYGVINKDGEYIYKLEYSDIIVLGEDRLALGKPLGKDEFVLRSIYAIGDTKGNLLTEYMYLEVGEYNDGLAYASNTTSTFFINKSGYRCTNLPELCGSGNLKLKDDIVQANLDDIQSYYKMDGEEIYIPKNKIKLDEKYSVIRKKYKPNINYLVYIPKIDGMRDRQIEEEVNYKLEEMSDFTPFTDGSVDENNTVTCTDVLDYSYNGNFNIKYYKKDFLVLELTGYYYPIGAAHGMPTMKTPCINLKDGTFYTLMDLFLEEKPWKEELSKIILNKINNDPEYSYVFTDTFKGITGNESFYVDNNNLYIYYSPYDIAPYSAGFVTFKIQFNEIERLIKKNGDFYKSIKVR